MGGRKWTNEEINKLKETYSKYSALEIAQTLNRTQESVQVKAGRLRLRKSSEYKIERGRQSGERSVLLRGDKLWTEEEREELRKLYATTPTRELANIFNCTIDAIRGQAWLLKLHKNKRFLYRTQFERAHKLGEEGEKIAQDFFHIKGWKVIGEGRNLGHIFGLTPFDFIVETDKHEKYAINVKHGESVSLKSLTVRNLMKLPYPSAILFVTLDKQFFFMPIIPLRSE